MVSVVVCCYNAAKFIDRCFGSLLLQTYKDLEIIFIDDGSTDNSYMLASSYKDKMTNKGMKLVLLRQTNQGAGYAAAYGLLHATGDYIMCFDVDDYLYPESICKMREFLGHNLDYAVVRTNGYRVKEFDDLSDAKLFVVDESEKKNIDIFSDLMLGKTNNWAGSYMVRASVLWKWYPEHKMLASRYGQNLQILAVAAYETKAGFIDEPLMQYIDNPDSFTNSSKTFDRHIELYSEFEKIRFDILDFLQVNDIGFRKKIKEVYYRIKMNTCVSFKEKKEFYKYYQSIKRVDGLSLEDKLAASIMKGHSLCRYYYSVVIRLRNILISNRL